MRADRIMVAAIWARIWHDQARCDEYRWPLLRAVVDLRAVVNIEDVHDTTVLVDPVDDAISAPPSAVTTSERPEQGLADPVRVDRKRGIAELQHGGGNCLREPLGDRSP
jgi:hypothetical protein